MCDGTYAAWEKKLKGSLELRKLVNLVILDRDPLRIVSKDLKHVLTIMTIIDGKIVYGELELGTRSECTG